MKIYSPKDLPLSFESVVTIGAFDGIHEGHKALLRETLRLSTELSLEPVVLTFEPHPRKVLQPQVPFKLLTTLEEKLELIEKEGFEKVVIIPFTKALAELSADLFVERYLIDLLRVKGVVVGFNFRFGKERKGDGELLKNLGTKYGFQVKIVPPVIIDNQRVSSSYIRDLLSRGEVEKASLFLGRPYFLRGKVIKGEGRGRGLGFPTANLEVSEEKLVPARGVYAVWVYLDKQKYKGALNIGFKPTFDGKKLSIEVHLLHFNHSQNLYGKILQVDFIKYLRGEKKFSSIEDLISQIRQDCQKVDKLLTD